MNTVITRFGNIKQVRPLSKETELLIENGKEAKKSDFLKFLMIFSEGGFDYECV